jgi:hypothetical protein
MTVEYANGGSSISVSVKDDNLVLDVEIKSLIGSKTKIKDLPKISAIIRDRLTSAFCEQIVTPNSKEFTIPFLLAGDGNIQVTGATSSIDPVSSQSENTNTQSASPPLSSQTVLNVIKDRSMATTPPSPSAAEHQSASNTTGHLHQHQSHHSHLLHQLNHRRLSSDSTTGSPYSSNPIIRKWEKEGAQRLRALQNTIANTVPTSQASSTATSQGSSMAHNDSGSSQTSIDAASENIVSGISSSLNVSEIAPESSFAPHITSHSNNGFILVDSPSSSASSTTPPPTVHQASRKSFVHTLLKKHHSSSANSNSSSALPTTSAAATNIINNDQLKDDLLLFEKGGKEN